jgi:hypothetical protein
MHGKGSTTIFIDFKSLKQLVFDMLNFGQPLVDRTQLSTLEDAVCMTCTYHAVTTSMRVENLAITTFKLSPARHRAPRLIIIILSCRRLTTNDHH